MNSEKDETIYGLNAQIAELKKTLEQKDQELEILREALDGMRSVCISQVSSFRNYVEACELMDLNS